MRGAYQTAYLATFAERISEKLKLQGPLDVGSAFDLVSARARAESWPAGLRPACR